MSYEYNDDNDTWEKIVNDFQDRYTKYSHDCVHPGCTVDGAGKNDGFLYSITTFQENGSEVFVCLCRTRAIALREGMDLLFHDSDGWFYESDWCWGYSDEEIAALAKRLGKTQELDEMYMKTYQMIQCVNCSSSGYYQFGGSYRSRVLVQKHIEPKIIEE